MWHPNRVAARQPFGNGLWQWYAWRWPFYRHQWTTQTIWRPGNVPFRNRAWQPDISGWTVGRFGFDLLKWSRDRGVDPSQVVINLNSGSTEFWNT